MKPHSASQTVVLSVQGNSRHAGFTLVETVIAVGIFAFAVVGILGVLPVALTTLKDSERDRVVSEIIAGISSQLRSDASVFSGNATASQFPRYFDVRGVEVNQANAVFKVTSPSAATAVALDGDPINSRLRVLSLEIGGSALGNTPLNFEIYGYGL